MSAPCPLYVCSMFALCPRYVRSMSALFPLHVRSMSASCPLHVRSMFALCPRYVRSMSALFPLHVRSTYAPCLLQVRSISAMCPLRVRSVPALRPLHALSVSALCPLSVFLSNLQWSLLDSGPICLNWSAPLPRQLLHLCVRLPCSGSAFDFCVRFLRLVHAFGLCERQALAGALPLWSGRRVEGDGTVIGVFTQDLAQVRPRIPQSPLLFSLRQEIEPILVCPLF